MEFLFYVAWVLLIAIPLFKLLPKYGMNALWSIFAVLPVGIIILLWIMAYKSDEENAS